MPSEGASRGMSATDHHTLQAFSGSIGWPTLQPKAWPNSGMFLTTPRARNFRGEWGLVCACMRSVSGRICAAPVLCESKEELLRRRVSILDFAQVDALLLRVGQKRDVGEAQAAVVCGIFSQG